MKSTVFECFAAPSATVERSLSGTRQSIFWLEDAPADRYPKLADSVNVDLAIVGARYCGRWTAITAKQRNADAVRGVRGAALSVVCARLQARRARHQ